MCLYIMFLEADTILEQWVVSSAGKEMTECFPYQEDTDLQELETSSPDI